MIAALVVVILAQGVLLAYLSRLHAAERSELYQRIQAPQMAVMENTEAPNLSLAFDDDDQFWAAREDVTHGS